MSGVGKTSIIDQFGRSEHEDVFNRDNGEAGEEAAAARWVNTEYLLKYSSVLSVVRSVFVNVDGEEAKLVMRESRGCPISRDCDCYVLVYSVNDAKSYGK